MTDTKAPASGWSFLTAMTPSLNQCLVVIVTAVVSIGGTVATQRLAASPPAPKVEAVAVKTIPVDTLTPRLAAAERRLEEQAADLAMLRAELAKAQEKRRNKAVSVPPKQ